VEMVPAPSFQVPVQVENPVAFILFSKVFPALDRLAFRFVTQRDTSRQSVITRLGPKPYH
jgi:hypothetical protein